MYLSIFKWILINSSPVHLVVFKNIFHSINDRSWAYYMYMISTYKIAHF